MDQTRGVVWCTVLGKTVEVVLGACRHPCEPLPGVPDGWTVIDCLEKDTPCYGTGCQFTTDGGVSPFGPPGEPPDGGDAPFDPTTNPPFDSE